MKTNLLHYKEIAAAINRPPITVYKWLYKNWGAIKAEDALKLQDATGVQAEAWIFPQKYKNPYFKAQDTQHNAQKVA